MEAARFHLSGLRACSVVVGHFARHVPYRGGGPALTDVMAGQVKFFFANGSSVVGLIKSGKLKAIAHTGKGRLASLPDIPPMSDTLPGFEALSGTACSSRTARLRSSCRS